MMARSRLQDTRDLCHEILKPRKDIDAEDLRHETEYLPDAEDWRDYLDWDECGDGEWERETSGRVERNLNHWKAYRLGTTHFDD